MRLEKDGTHTVLSGGMNGQKFSGPNDIAIAADDAVYVTDNDFGLRDGGRNPDKQLQNGIYRIKDGQTSLVLSGSDLGGIPNGIALSPDGKWMYLSTANRHGEAICRESRRHAGGVHCLHRRRRHRRREKTDTAGNLYSTGGAGPGIVRITSPAGKLLGTINLPIYGGEPKRQICATNEAFGGSDGRTLFIAGCDSVYTIQLKTPGIVPAHNVNKQ